MSKKPRQPHMCSWLFTEQSTNYKMVKTKYNSVNGMTFETQSQSVDCDIKSCQSEGNGQIDRIYVGNAGDDSRNEQ